MILPYVYKLTHKETDQFYIGSRTNKLQNLPAEKDILKYKSSSKYVKELGFENFFVEILAEFFSPKDAYDFEQELIYLDFKNPLILNKSCFHKKKQFNPSGLTVKEETKRKLSESRTGEKHHMFGKSHSEETKLKISKTLNGKYYGKVGVEHHNYKKIVSKETREKQSLTRTGKKVKPRSQEERLRMSERSKGIPKPWLRKVSLDLEIEIFDLFKNGKSRNELYKLFNDFSKSTIKKIIQKYLKL